MVLNGVIADGGFAPWAVVTDTVQDLGGNASLPLRKNHRREALNLVGVSAPKKYIIASLPQDALQAPCAPHPASPPRKPLCFQMQRNPPFWPRTPLPFPKPRNRRTNKKYPKRPPSKSRAALHRDTRAHALSKLNDS